MTLETQGQIASFKRFKNTHIWKAIVETFQKDINDCEKTINTIGADNEKIYTDRDLAILQKNDIIKLINFPDEQIKALSGSQDSSENINNILNDEDIPDLLDDEEDV